MPFEVAMWRVEDGTPQRLRSSGAPLEAGLEQLIEADPMILGERLLLIGRQVPTSHGTLIDLLAVDAEGELHVLELKRERTPREVVAQALDYGAWVQSLSHDDVLALFASYQPGVAFEQAFDECFGSSPPEELNTSHNLTIVASGVDGATERIVTYLRDRYDVPINVAFFNYFLDDGREYLARTWLADEAVTPVRPRARNSSGSKREDWDGRYWYVSFGDDPGSRSWDDASNFGFISAGGGLWYSRTIRALPEGVHVFVCIPKRGYVGFGTVIGPARRLADAVVTVDGVERKLSEIDLVGNYRHPNDEEDDNAEWFAPLRWGTIMSREHAVWKPGMFANQNSACKLSNKFTVELLEEAFGIASLDEPNTDAG